MAYKFLLYSVFLAKSRGDQLLLAEIISVCDKIAAMIEPVFSGQKAYKPASLRATRVESEFYKLIFKFAKIQRYLNLTLCRKFKYLLKFHPLFFLRRRYLSVQKAYLKFALYPSRLSNLASHPRRFRRFFENKIWPNFDPLEI